MWHSPSDIMRMSVNGASTVLGHVFRVIWWGGRLQVVINKVLAAFIGQRESTTLLAPSWKWASMEHQRFLVMYLGSSGGWYVAHSHKLSIGCHWRQKKKWNAPCPIMIMSMNGVSTIVGVPLWLIAAGCGRYCLYTWFWLFWYAKWLKNI